MDRTTIMRRRAACFFTLLIFCIISSIASDYLYAQDEKERVAWTVSRYEIEVSIDIAKQYINEQVTIDIEATEDTYRVDFMLNESLHVLDARTAQGIVDYKKAGEVLMIKMEPPLRGKNTLFIDLEGRILTKRSSNRTAFMEDSILLSWEDYWYPFAEDSWATSLIRVKLPKGFKTVGPGRMLRGREIGNVVIHTWQSDIPSSCYSLAADKHWVIQNARQGKLSVQSCLYPGSGDALSERIMSSARDVMTYYSEIFCPYPFQRVSFIELEGLKDIETFNGFIAYPPESCVRVYSSEGFDALSPAFLWWGNVINGSGSTGQQWIRGLGSYAEYLYCERMKLPSTYSMEKARTDYFLLDGYLDRPFSELDRESPPALVFGKGAGIMEMLRYTLGDVRFFKGIQELFDKRMFTSISLDQLRETFEIATNTKLRKFFDEWFFRSGAPKITMRPKIRETYKKDYRVDVKIVQEGAVYTLPVEIMMTGRNNSRIEKFQIENSVHDLFFTYDFKPDQVVFDPQNKIFRWRDDMRERSLHLALRVEVDNAIQAAVKLEREEKYDDAKKVYETALDAARNSIELLYNYARMEQGRKNYDKALDLYKKAEKGESVLRKDREPLRPWCFIRKGNIYDLMGMRDKALKEYNRALTFPDYWDSKKMASKYIKEPYMEK